MATCDLFIILIGQPSRACWALAEECGLIAQKKVALKLVNFVAGEHREPWFLEINANGSIPALRDNEHAFGMGESVAIMKYLVQRFNLAEHWYPSDLFLRTRIDDVTLSLEDTQTSLRTLVSEAASAIDRRAPRVRPPR